MSIRVLEQRFFAFPPFVTVVALAAEPGGEDTDALLAELLAVSIPGKLADAAPRRIYEYRFGRLAAVLALRALGSSNSGAPPRGLNGEPIWPANICGSITHTDGFAAAAVAANTEANAIGIDAETMIDPERLAEISQVVLHQEEEAELLRSEGNGQIRPEVRLGVISAKESVMKCLLPQRGPLDFLDIRLEDIEATGPQNFVAKFICPAVFSGTIQTAFQYDGTRVYSCCIFQGEA